MDQKTIKRIEFEVFDLNLNFDKDYIKDINLIGLDRYTIEFFSLEDQDLFIKLNKEDWIINEIFINNSYGLEIKKIKKVVF